MRNRKSSKMLLVVKIVVLLIVIAIGVLFFYRNSILNYYVNKKISKFSTKYNAELRVGKITFSGINSISITDIYIKPLNKDTLLTIKAANTKLSLIKLVFGKISFSNFELDRSCINIIKDENGDNFSFLLKKKKINDPDSLNLNYAERFSHIFDMLFDLAPRKANINQFTVNTNIQHHLLSFYIDKLTILNRNFKTTILVKDSINTVKWQFEGNLDPVENHCLIKLYANNHDKVTIPIIEHIWGGSVRFDTIQLAITNNGISSGKLNFEGLMSVSGLCVNHPKISGDTVEINKASLSYQCNIGKDYVELDSTSVATFNKLTLNPYIKIRPKPSRQITLILNKTRFPAQDLFSSLPEGLFTKLRGIETKGDLSYHLKFFIDWKCPDSLILDSDLKKYEFKIEHYGAGDLGMINHSFMYTAYEHNQAVRSFIVGPENSNFKELNQIPEALRDAVLTSEDNAFYWHRGILPDAFKNSIATNVKRKKFVRGGSTITMQLVKNVFLTRNKTVARKLEEMLIVWLIENNNLVSKDRMFEVYLNIIEWGPLVYGANEASHFYFNKDVSRLSLAEIIYLTSIIPHPKSFKYSFGDDEHLKPYLEGYYHLIAEKMLKREKISQDEYDKLVPDVDLKGPAKFMLKKPTISQIDSLFSTPEDSDFID